MGGILFEIRGIEHSPVIFLKNKTTGAVSASGHNSDLFLGTYLHDESCVRCRMERAISVAAFRIKGKLSDEMHVEPSERRLLKFSQWVLEDILGVYRENKDSKK